MTFFSEPPIPAAEDLAEMTPDRLPLLLVLMKDHPARANMLILHTVRGYNYADTAAILGARFGTVKSGISRGRQELIELLANNAGAPKIENLVEQWDIEGDIPIEPVSIGAQAKTVDTEPPEIPTGVRQKELAYGRAILARLAAGTLTHDGFDTKQILKELLRPRRPWTKGR